MNKPVYLGLSKYSYDYIKRKYVKTDDIYKDIAKDVEKICDTSNFKIDRYLKEKIKK